MAHKYEERCKWLQRPSSQFVKKSRRCHDRRDVHYCTCETAEIPHLVETCETANLLHTAVGPKEIGEQSWLWIHEKYNILDIGAGL